MDATQHLETWKKRVEKELAGAPFESLRTTTPTGVVIEPLYVATTAAGHVAAARCALADAQGSDAGVAIDLARFDAEHAADQIGLAATLFVAALRAGDPAQVTVRVPVAADLVLEIAKLRALRRVLARIQELLPEGATRPTVALHAVASSRLAAAPDLPTCLIWNAAAVFSAVVGGADRMTPHALDPTSPEHRRLADNVVRLALHESHLDAVHDPAAGSWAFETLTDDLCRRAWNMFQALEADPAARARHLDAEATR